MNADFTTLVFLAVGIVGMFLAGLLGDWYDDRRAHRIGVEIRSAWENRKPGDGFGRRHDDA